MVTFLLIYILNGVKLAHGRFDDIDACIDQAIILRIELEQLRHDDRGGFICEEETHN